MNRISIIPLFLVDSLGINRIYSLYGETRKCCVQRKLTSSRIIDIVSVSRYMVVGGEPVAVVPPGSPPYYYPCWFTDSPIQCFLLFSSLTLQLLFLAHYHCFCLHLHIYLYYIVVAMGQVSDRSICINRWPGPCGITVTPPWAW